MFQKTSLYKLKQEAILPDSAKPRFFQSHEVSELEVREVIFPTKETEKII